MGNRVADTALPKRIDAQPSERVEEGGQSHSHLDSLRIQGWQDLDGHRDGGLQGEPVNNSLVLDKQ